MMTIIVIIIINWTWDLVSNFDFSSTLGLFYESNINNLFINYSIYPRQIEKMNGS